MDWEKTLARGPICPHCDEKLAPKQAFCGKCGHPTEHASHDERVLWDLGQWEVSRRKASGDPRRSDRPSESAVRTKELFRSAQEKATDSAVSKPGGAPDGGSGAETSRRFTFGRIRRDHAADAPAAKAPAAEVAPKGPARPAPGAPARRAVPVRPAASGSPQRPAARPNGTAATDVPAARSGAVRSTPPSRVRSSSKPSDSRTGTIAPDRPASRPTDERKVATGRARTTPPATPATDRPPVEAPLVVIRKAVVEAEAPTAPGPAVAAKAAPAPAPAAPAKPSRSERRAAEDARREAERARKQDAKEAERRREEQKKEAARAKAEVERSEELRRKGEAKDARKRERKHRRHSKRVDRRAAELDLRSGERVSLSISGWSRFRRATLVVTNYRVALITQMPAQVRWIPLEEVNDVHHRWAGAHSLVVTSPIEVLTLQKSKREALGSFENLLEAEVAEARRPGRTERHHADITQEWCDRSTEVWDSHTGRLRLWIRHHPLGTLATLGVFVVAAYVVSSIVNPYH